MSDVMEVMVECICECNGNLTYGMQAALRAAEHAGWRLVPAEGTDHQLDVLAEVYEDRGDSFAYREAIQAAPRPWEEA